MAGADAPRQLNVVLVTIDTLRADYLGCYGHPEIATPHIDRLASEGIRFSNAATTVPFTLPAHSSMMTGTYPPHHGVRENVGYFLDESIPTLAEHLAASGRDTAGFVSAFVLDARWGIARGFDHYHDDFDVASLRQINLGSVQRDGRETLDATISWLDDRAADAPPFFLWLHLFDPHEPYLPAEPFRSQYPDDPYGAEVAYTDSLIGELREALEERGLFDNSLVILTADHGEGLGDHGESFHGFFVYDSTVHVPLIIRTPYPELAGRVVEEAVSHVDLKPTVLEAIGEQAPANIQGRSLLPLMLGVAEDAERVVYSESYYSLFHYGWAPLRTLRTTSHKLIDVPRPELYELANDPGEASNLYSGKRGTARQLELQLRDLMASFEDAAPEREQQPDLDEETLEQLRALGYVAGRGEVAGDDDTPRADPKDKIEVHQSIMWAQTFIGQGKDEKAEQRLREALARDPGMLDAHQMLGNIASKRQRYSEAIAHFQRALALDADHRTSLFGLANAYRRSGQLREALVGFQRLQSLAPHDSKAAVAMTEIHVEQGDLPAALAAIEQAAKAPDAPALVHNQHGELLALSGRVAEASQELERAIATNPRLAQPHFNLAVLTEEQGDLDRAIDLYEQTLERAPRHFQAQFNLGRLAGARGDLDRQQELWVAAIASYPDFVRGYYYLAKLYMDRGDLGRAEELARDGIARDPEHRAGPLGYFVLADLLNRTGRRDEAMRAVAKGREIQQRETL